VRQDPISKVLNLFNAIDKMEYMMSKQIKGSECEAIGGGMIIKSCSWRGEVFLLGFNGVPDAARSSASDEGRVPLEGSGEGGATDLGFEC
jgi:hypothetical protein